jgi:hypothetical protein
MASTTRRAPVAGERGEDDASPSTVQRAFLFVGLVLIAVAVSTFAVGGGNAFDKEPFDLTINLVAADRLNVLVAELGDGCGTPGGLPLPATTLPLIYSLVFESGIF